MASRFFHRFVSLAALLLLPIAATAGDKGAKSGNPHKGKPEAAKQGGELYRGYCGGCHGGTGHGGKCPDLTDDMWIHGGKDDEIFHTISKGAPGTEMRNFEVGLKPDEVWMLVTYIRSLAASGGESAWKPFDDGNAKRGKTLFFDKKGQAQCFVCHMVQGEGGRKGPDLSRIAAKRTPAYILESIVNPNLDIVEGYQQFTVTTKDGSEVIGYKKNEDSFSMQLISMEEQLVSLDKMSITGLSTNKTSVMPGNFEQLLNKKDLHDLMAFLKTLTGQTQGK